MTLHLDQPVTLWLAVVSSSSAGPKVALLTGLCALSAYLFYVMIYPEKF